jgi:hypothetical protein
MTLPVVYTADSAAVKVAVANIRTRVKNLAEPRLYQTAVALTILARLGKATVWHSWDTPPPTKATRFGRAQIADAMWQMFGTQPGALLKTGSTLGQGMNNPSRVMLDVLYGANGPITLVGDTLIAADSRQNSAKLEINDPNLRWSDSATAPTSVTFAEYNPVNSMGQQNGIGCAWPTSEAVSPTPSDPEGVYEVKRALCPKRRLAIGGEPTCLINGEVCGGQGDGGARAVTKPRLLAPPSPNSKTLVVLPGAVASLVAQATREGKRQLPSATDLSLLVSWCHTNGAGVQDGTRLTSLLGAKGLRMLASHT